MNTLVAASLFDNPWVFPLIILLTALTNWLMKRRQGNRGDSRPDGEERLPTPDKPQERSPQQLDLQEALRQLLGGEPPPRAPQPPPIPPVMRDAQPVEVWSDGEPFQPEHAWMDEPQETPKAVRLPVIQTAPTSRPRPAVGPVRQARPALQTARRSEPLTAPPKHPAPGAGIMRGRRSREGARAIELLRDHRTVRQAFVASLVFGPPKAFES